VLTYSSPRVDTTFASGDGVRDVVLGSFGTTGYADGAYRIDVTLYDALETPIPGATGSSNIVVGQPFAATLAVNPSALAPGNSTVNLALTLDRSLLAQPNLQLRSTTALSLALQHGGEERQLSLYLPERQGQHRQREQPDVARRH
jgi:hypothetical protein